MTIGTMTAEQAILASVGECRTVTMPWSQDAEDALTVECDDHASENDGSEDYWGTTEDGDEWRVTLVRAEVR